MSYRVLIRRNSDGIERWTKWYPWYDTDATNPGSILFSWQDNNFSCDCNRHLEFERAGDRTEEDLMNDEIECGETLYHVLRFESDDGRVVDAGKGQWVPAPLLLTDSRP